MGYRSPERVKKLNMDSGLGALQAITEFLSMGVENTRNDANQWVQGANQTISSIDSAGTSKQFEELERLIDDYMDIGQEYTDILGDESYHAKALELQNKLNQKQGVLGRFENAMNTSANLAFDPKYKFNLDDFYTKEGALLTGTDFVDALQAFDERRGGENAPIFWGDFDPDRGADFLNFWANLSDYGSPGLMEKYAPMTVLSQGMDSVLNTQQYLKEMGVEYDASTGLVNVPSGADIERDYEISYMKDGQMIKQKIPLSQIVRQSFDNMHAYQGLSEIMSNQLYYPTRVQYDVDGNLIDFTDPAMARTFVSDDEVLLALSMPHSDFKTESDTKKKNIVTSINTSYDNINSYVKLQKSLREAKTRASDSLDFDMSTAQDIGIDTSQDLQGMIDDTKALIEDERANILKLMIKGAAWGLTKNQMIEEARAKPTLFNIAQRKVRDKAGSGGVSVLDPEKKLEELQQKQRKEVTEDYVSIDNIKNNFSTKEEFFDWFMPLYMEAGEIMYYNPDEGDGQQPVSMEDIEFVDSNLQWSNNTRNFYIPKKSLERISQIEHYNTIMNEISDKMQDKEFKINILEEMIIDTHAGPRKLYPNQLIKIKAILPPFTISNKTEQENQYYVDGMPPVEYQSIESSGVSVSAEVKIGKRKEEFAFNLGELYTDKGNLAATSNDSKIVVGSAGDQEFDLLTLQWSGGIDYNNPSNIPNMLLKYIGQ